MDLFLLALVAVVVEGALFLLVGLASRSVSIDDVLDLIEEKMGSIEVKFTPDSVPLNPHSETSIKNNNQSKDDIFEGKILDAIDRANFEIQPGTTIEVNIGTGKATKKINLQVPKPKEVVEPKKEGLSEEEILKGLEDGTIG